MRRLVELLGKNILRFEKDLSVTFLLDIYESLLSKNQAELMRLYFDHDHSLAEVALYCGITRQAAQDSIKRAQSKLNEFEHSLKMGARYIATKHLLHNIENGCDIQMAVKHLREAWED